MKLNLKAISLGGLAAVALLAAPLALLKSANAEGSGHQGPNFEQLNLTEAQSAKIEAIRTDSRSQIAALLTPEQRIAFENSSGRDGFRELDLTDDQRSQIRAIKESSREQIDAVLTDEQRQELVAMRPEGGRHGRGDRFEALNLTDDQSAQIEAIRTETKSQMDALLTPEQRATLGEGNEGRRGFRNLNLSDEQRQQMQAIHQASHEKINAVLTPEQRQQLPERPEGRQGAPQANQ